MKYLLDTCIISELTKKKPDKRVVDWLKHQDEFSLFLSVITFGELQKGIDKLPDGRKRIKLQSWIEYDLARRFSARIISVDQEVATCWGALSGKAERAGRRIPVLDGLLAATARSHGLTLVTRNTQHFQGTKITVLDPWQELKK